jgi:hypothetical protein
MCQVFDTPEDHVTRDYREGLAQLGDLQFKVVDTSGLEPAAAPRTLQVRYHISKAQHNINHALQHTNMCMPPHLTHKLLTQYTHKHASVHNQVDSGRYCPVSNDVLVALSQKLSQKLQLRAGCG